MKADDLDIGQLLGSGGFAFVYQARFRADLDDARNKELLRKSRTPQQNKIDDIMALKVISKEKLVKDNIANRIVNEIKIHRKLNHSCFVKLIDFFEDASNVYMCLELCSFGNFYHHIKRNGPLSEYEAGYVMYQLIDGLNYLHNQGFVHRDLKLSNILISGARSLNQCPAQFQSRPFSTQEETTLYEIKVCDFGLAASLGGPEEEHFTLCGTPNYIAPEIASQQAHGFPVDIWSAGCLFYSMVEGALPFDQGEDVAATLRRVVNGEYTQPSHLSPTALDFLNRLLEMNPLRRPTASAMLKHPFLRPYQCDTRAIRLSTGTGTGSISSSSGSVGNASASRSAHDSFTVLSHTRVSVSPAQPRDLQTAVVDTSPTVKKLPIMNSSLDPRNRLSLSHSSSERRSMNATTGSDLSRATPVTDAESRRDESSLSSGALPAASKFIYGTAVPSTQIHLPKPSQSVANVSAFMRPSLTAQSGATAGSTPVFAPVSASNASGSSWLAMVKGLRQSLTGGNSGGGYMRESVPVSTTSIGMTRQTMLDRTLASPPSPACRSSRTAGAPHQASREQANECISWTHLAGGVGPLSYCAPTSNPSSNPSSHANPSQHLHYFINNGCELVQISATGEVLCVTTLRDKRGTARLCRLLVDPQCSAELLICNLSEAMLIEVDTTLRIKHGLQSPRSDSATISGLNSTLRSSLQSGSAVRRSLALGTDDSLNSHDLNLNNSSPNSNNSTSTLFQVHPSSVLKRVSFAQLPRALLPVHQRVVRLLEVLRSRVPKIILYVLPRDPQLPAATRRSHNCSSFSSAPPLSSSTLTGGNDSTQYESCKCMLMMNGPLPDFCVQWKNGARLRYSLRTGACSLQYPREAAGSETAEGAMGQWHGRLSAPSQSDTGGGHSHATASVREYLRVAQASLARCLQVDRSHLASASTHTAGQGGSRKHSEKLQPHILCESLMAL